MIETSSDLLRSSSAIFGNLQKMSGNVRKMFGNVSPAFCPSLENLRKSSENGRKSSENRHIYITQRKLHGCLEIRNLSSHVEKYFTRSLCSLVKYFSKLEDKFRISVRPCNILYLS